MMKKFILSLLLLSTQVFAGPGPVVIWGPGPTAKFLAPAAFKDGTVGAPSLTFSAEPTTGWYRIAPGDVGLSTLGVLSMEVIQITPAQINFGFGTAASAAGTNPFNAATTINNIAHFNYSNLSTGASSTTAFDIGNGTGGGAPLTLYNKAYSGVAYSGGGGALDASSSLSFLNIASESTTGFITFNTGGALAAATERMRIDQYGHFVYKGTAPTVTAACGTAPSVTGNDSAGVLNVGTGGTATTCTVTFANTWTTTPHCFVQDET